MRDLFVDDHRRAGVAAEVPALDRVAAAREHQLLAVEHEPHRHHVRLSAGPAGTRHRRGVYYVGDLAARARRVAIEHQGKAQERSAPATLHVGDLPAGDGWRYAK